MSENHDLKRNPDRKTHGLTLAVYPSPVRVSGSTKGNVVPAGEGHPGV